MRSLAVILALFAGLTIAYNATLPLAEVSDATAHFSLIRFMAENGRPPLTEVERTAVGIKGDASPLYHGLVAAITQHVDIASLPELPYIHDRGERAIPADNRIIQDILHTEDESFPWHGIVLAWHLAGLLSIPMGMATIIAIYVTVRLMFPERPYLAVGAAAFVAFLPRFVISSAVINDDNLVFPLIAFALYLLIRIIHGDERWFIFPLVGLLVGLAVVTKYHSAVLVAEMVLVIGLVSWRHGWRVMFQRWAASLVVCAVAAGWWLVFITINFNAVDEMGVAGGLVAPLGDPVLTLGVAQLFGAAFNTPDISLYGYWASWTFRSFWMHYNGIYTGMEAIGRESTYWALYWAFGVISAGALMGSVVAMLRGRWRWDVALLVAHLAIYAALVLLRYTLFPAWSTSQGRHLYPALLSFAVIASLGWAQIFGGRDRAMAWSLGGGMVAICVMLIPVFFRPVYYPFLPLVTAHPDAWPIENRLEIKYDGGLRFEGYALHHDLVRAGDAIPLMLYWRAEAKQHRDYLAEVCLHDESGTVVTCYRSHPVGGRYPMRAWEEGYLIKDAVFVPTPACLAPGAYRLTLAVRPLRLEALAATVDASVEMPPPEPLATVSISEGQSPRSGSFAAWLGDRRYQGGHVTMWQIRQPLTVLSYAADTSAITRAGGEAWQPLTESLRFTCNNDVTVTTQTYIVHPGLERGTYQLADALDLRIHTRERTFEPPADLGTVVNANFADTVAWLGYEVELTPRYPGERIEITTHWHALRTMSRLYTGSFHLLDNTVTMWSQADHALGGDYPTVLWAPGEIVADVYYVPIHEYVPPGQYRLKFSLYEQTPQGFAFLTTPTDAGPTQDIIIGQVRILDPARQHPPAVPLQVTLGDAIQLLGYEVSSSALSTDAPLSVGLHWQAIAPPSRDYTVFTQLLGPDGRVWGQQDNQPQGGSYPTSAWAVRDTVVDRYALTLAPDAPRGPYQLLVGMYDLSTGQRLPAVGAEGQRWPADAIILATLDY